MLISEFARTTGLSPDTIRFYVRRGLITPATGIKGGSKPYQVFTAEHVEAARIIRMAQSLGFSLKEIAALNEEFKKGALTRARSLEIMRQQLDRLTEKAKQLEGMTSYIRAKIAWLESGSQGPEPAFGEQPACLPEQKNRPARTQKRRN